MFMAYFPANTTYESILADIYAGAVSNPGGSEPRPGSVTSLIHHSTGFNWLCSPACTELEVVQMDWVAQLLGLDSSFHNSGNVGGGVIMGSASEACLTACIAARERALRLHPGTPFEQMVIVGTTQTHSLGAKAALILGLSFEAVDTKEEDQWALRGPALKKTLDRLKGEGKLPFALRGLSRACPSIILANVIPEQSLR